MTHPDLPPNCSCVKYDHEPKTGFCRCVVTAPMLRAYLWQMGEWDMYIVASIMAREWRTARPKDEVQAALWETWGPRPAKATNPDAVEFKVP